MKTKKQPNSFNNSLISILVITIIGFGIYMFFTSNSNYKTKLAPQIETTAVDQTDLLCDTAAKTYFNNYWNKPTEGVIIEKSFRNHYNTNSKTCYVLVKYYFNYQMINSDTHWTYGIYDLYNKDSYGNPRKVGDFSQNMSSKTSYSEVTECTVGDTKCYSLNDFLNRIESYFNN